MMKLLLLLTILAIQPDAARQDIEFIRLAYKSNKDAFQFGTFRFEYERGLCASFSDAEAGKFSTAVKADGFYSFEGQNARYELVPKPGDLAAATKSIDERKTSSFMSAFRMLTDGKVMLLDHLRADETATVLVHKSTIVPEAAHFYRKFDFPLFIGDRSVRDYDLFSDLTRLLAGEASLDDLDMNSRLNGQKVCKLRFTYKHGTRTYWIDLDRGAVPLRILNQANLNKLEVTTINENIEFLPHAGWLPRRKKHIIGPGSIADWIVLTDIDITTKPAPAVFQLDFPEPIAVVNQANRLAYSPRKTWSLLSLPGPNSAGTKRVSMLPPPISTDELPGEIESSGFGWALVAALTVVVLLVCVVAAIIFRKMSR